MKWSDAQSVVEELRRDTQLYLPALSKRRGFSSSRIEHLLNRLVKAMPVEECYLEIGTLEGRTLEAASVGNEKKLLIGVDPCEKYDTVPTGFAENVAFIQSTWQYFLSRPTLNPVGLVFYDGDHSAEQTRSFMSTVAQHCADEAVLVLDDWDRETVRNGAFSTGYYGECGWRLLREMPEYTGGLEGPQHHFGYSFGVSVWGFKS